jgi:hypothetical protein
MLLLPRGTPRSISTLHGGLLAPKGESEIEVQEQAKYELQWSMLNDRFGDIRDQPSQKSVLN